MTHTSLGLTRLTLGAEVERSRGWGRPLGTGWGTEVGRFLCGGARVAAMLELVSANRLQKETSRDAELMQPFLYLTSGMTNPQFNFF